MGKNSLFDIGVLLSVIGAIIMVIFGILRVISALGIHLLDVSGYDYNLVGDALIGGIIAIILGLVVLYLWKNKVVENLIYGIILIIVGIIGGSLGGLLILIGGILIVLDEFL